MSKCKVCSKPRSKYVLNNKLVCMRCDELIFDLEIECEEEPIAQAQSTGKSVEASKKAIPTPFKKI